MANLLDNPIVGYAVAKFHAGDMDKQDALDLLLSNGLSQSEAIRLLRANPNPYAAAGYDPFPGEPQDREPQPTVAQILANFPAANSFTDGAALSAWAKTQQANPLFRSSTNFLAAVNQRIREAGDFLAKGEGVNPPPPQSAPVGGVGGGTPPPPHLSPGNNLLGRAAQASVGLDDVAVPLRSQFARFLAAQPFGAFNNDLDAIAQTREAPLQVTHLLQSLAAGDTAGQNSFQNYLQGLGPETFFGQQGATIQSLLDQIRRGAGNPTVGEGVMSGLEANADPIMEQFFSEKVSPLLAPFVRAAAHRRLLAFQNNNPGANPFAAFLANNYNLP